MLNTAPIATDTLDAGPLLASAFQPPKWLRNPHLQSILSSSERRRRHGLKLIRALGAVTDEHIFDGGDGVRLQGWHSQVPGREARGLALLLHGWEGSSESSYMRMSAARMLEAGFDVVRLNFRDHGGTYHLNEGVFHSCRIGEVVNAAADVARRFHRSGKPMVLAGYSLGGNFALRLALRAPGAGIPLSRVAAVCPVVDPFATLDNFMHSLPVYHWYFQNNWRRSLRRKRALFPSLQAMDDEVLNQNMRELTRWIVERYTEFGTLDNYLEGYSIAGERLLGLQVPAHILMAQDDPVIPFTDFRELKLPAQAELDVARWGGHCGFVENAACDGFSERWLAQRLAG